MNKKGEVERRGLNGNIWLKEAMKWHKYERENWNFITNEFPEKLQTRIKKLKEQKGKIARTISAQEIHNKTGEYKNKKEIIKHYNIQIKECQRILNALRQSVSELLNIGENSPYPPSDEILKVKKWKEVEKWEK